jgi:IS30 family transposase
MISYADGAGICKAVGAKSMGRNKSTISRELSRNTGKRGYRHKQANRLADERPNWAKIGFC